MRRLLFTIFCLVPFLFQAQSQSDSGSIWQEGSQWDVIYSYATCGMDDSVDVVVLKYTYRLLPADDSYMALEKTVAKDDKVIFTEVQGYIRNDHDRVIYVRPVLEDDSIGDECLLYDFSEPFEYGGTVRYGVIGGEVKEEFIDWQEDSLDYYMMNNGDTHCLPAWKGIIYKYGYIGGPMDLFLLEAAPGKTKRPKPSNISHVIFSTKGGHKKTLMYSEENEDDIIIPYDEMLTDGTSWECMAITPEQPDLKNSYTIQVMGDTIVGNRRCKQIYSPEYDIQKTMFEEGRKVYVVNTEGNPEVLLDFNLQEGDRLDEVTNVVWVRDEVNMGNHYRTITIDMGFDCESYFEGDEAPWAYDLIEGIGMSKDQYLKLRFIDEEHTFSYLLRCWKDGKLAYQVAQEQEYEYVPFVREGVKWVYYYYNDLATEALDMPEGTQYLAFEMKGDVEIGGKHYKPVVLTYYYGENGLDKEVEDFVPIYLREEDKVVYAIHADGIQHPQCPAGIYQYISFPNQGLPITASTEEFVLYDFNEPKMFYDTFFEEDNYFLELAGYGSLVEYVKTDTILLGNNRQSKCHHFDYILSDVDKIIEGVGYDGNAGMPLFYFERFITGFQVYYYLSHVIEDGQIIYKSVNYREPQTYDDYEYVPFVREGVKWIYRYINPFWRDVLDMDEGIQYYSFEMGSDVLVGDKYYKPVVLTHYLDNNTKEVEDFIPVYLREENKVVYAILPDGILHPQCPVGYGRYIGAPSSLPIYTTNEEFVLYDFNNMNSFYNDMHSDLHPGPVRYNGWNMINIGSHKSKSYHYDDWYEEDEVITESIGYDGIAGMPLFYFELFTTGLQVEYGLSHVVENGEIVYKGKWYSPDITLDIDEVVVDLPQRVQDENYYNLMGQPVGKDVPTTPGIYIHQGKKILVH